MAQIAGGERTLSFDNAALTIRIADERGKIPINHLEDDGVRRMLEQAGLSGPALDVASDSLLDWLDDDNQPRPHGAEAADYAPQGISPRNGGLLSLGELARVRGIGPVLARRLARYVTVDPDVLALDHDHARPEAVAAMTENGDLGPEAIERQRAVAGQRAALDSVSRKDLVAVPLSIAVDARTGDGGHAHVEGIVVLTGDDDRPYAFHAVS